MKGGLSSTSSPAFFCSGGLLGELPLGRHDEIGVIVAVIARVGVVTVVEVVKAVILANCSCEQDRR